MNHTANQVHRFRVHGVGGFWVGHSVSAVAVIALLSDGCATWREPALPYVGLDSGPVRPTPTLEPYVKDGERVGGLYVIEGMPPELLVNSRTQNNRLRLIVWRLRFGSAEWGSVFPKPRLLRDRRAAPGGTKEAVGNIILV